MQTFNPKKSLGLGAAALSLTLLAGVASAQSASGAMSGTSKVAHTDSAFLKQAAQNGNEEVEASKLALTKSSSAQVKAFAQKMIDDHTQAGDELKALASSKGVEVSDKPSIAQSAQIKLLDAMSGTNFDSRYASMIGVSAHAATVKLFQKAVAGAKDADVKAFASKTLPTLQHHLEMAQSLKSETAAKSS